MPDEFEVGDRVRIVGGIYKRPSDPRTGVVTDALVNDAMYIEIRFDEPVKKGNKIRTVTRLQASSLELVEPRGVYRVDSETSTEASVETPSEGKDEATLGARAAAAALEARAGMEDRMRELHTRNMAERGGRRLTSGLKLRIMVVAERAIRERADFGDVLREMQAQLEQFAVDVDVAGPDL